MAGKSEKRGCLFARAGASGFASWKDFEDDELVVNEVNFDKVQSVTYSKIYQIANGQTPAQSVLESAAGDGPSCGWKNGWLTLENGFFEPKLGESLSSLRRTPGYVWHQNCLRLPALIQNGTVMVRIQEIHFVRYHAQKVFFCLELELHSSVMIWQDHMR